MKEHFQPITNAGALANLRNLPGNNPSNNQIICVSSPETFELLANERKVRTNVCHVSSRSPERRTLLIFFDSTRRCFLIETTAAFQSPSSPEDQSASSKYLELLISLYSIIHILKKKTQKNFYFFKHLFHFHEHQGFNSQTEKLNSCYCSKQRQKKKNQPHKTTKTFCNIVNTCKTAVFFIVLETVKDSKDFLLFS